MLLIAVTLILLKLGFLLLLVVGPFFLLIGTHPGFGRVVALRWFEMLVGVLLKQAAVALVLSVLLYAYSLIMGTSDAALPWALKILMIALVTMAVFIYRRPFQHLFSAVGYGMIGSTERAEIDLQRSRADPAREHARRRGRRRAGVRRLPRGPMGAAQPWAGGGARRGRRCRRRGRCRGRGDRGAGGGRTPRMARWPTEPPRPGSRRPRAGPARAAAPGWRPAPAPGPRRPSVTVRPLCARR